MELKQNTVLIIADANELKDAGQVWGTGGWLPPEKRIALDWFTLCRFMGLNVLVKEAEEFHTDIILSERIRWVILACDPNSLDDKFIKQLTITLKNYPISLIGQPGEYDSSFARWCAAFYGSRLKKGDTIYTKLLGDKNKWTCRSNIECRNIQHNDNPETIASLENFPIITGSQKELGKLILLAFNPSELRDHEGLITHLLQRLLIFTSDVPIAWLNWQNTLVLRMDDPGSSETVHHRCYDKPKLRKEEWEKIGEELVKRNGRMSIGYVSGWVDDGDESLGELLINGESVSRGPGHVYPSPLVKYRAVSRNENEMYDYQEEFESIQNLRKQGLAEVEMHGFTHIFPDRNAWLNAPDKYENNSWYREFGSHAIQFLQENPLVEHPVDSALRQFKLFFGIKPSTLISPGEVFTDDVLIKALREGIMLVSSYYLAIRHHDRFCWSQHVCAPYLDKPDEKWFDAALPVVGYFHDFDISEKGIDWFSECLNHWQKAGAKRIIDFYELNSMLNLQSEIKIEDGDITLEIRNKPPWPMQRPFSVYLFFPGTTVPDFIKASINDVNCFLEVKKVEKNIGRVLLTGVT